MKTCRKCGILFEGIRCKPCLQRWNYENKDRELARKKKYRAENPHIMKRARANYYARNKQKIKIKSMEYRISHQENRRIYDQNRRLNKIKNGGSLSIGLFNKLFQLQRGKCACCHADLMIIKPHMDHIIPLVLGGSNEDSNIQLLCQPCNNQKHTKHPIDFMQSRGFLL